MKLASEPHVPFAIPVRDGRVVVVALPCLQCILDSWTIRALTAARMSVTYRVGTTNWALRPVQPAVAIRRAS